MGLFAGLSYAGITGAGKDQMLAGGAIVLGYGIIGAMIALIISIFLVPILSSMLIKPLNFIYIFLIIGFVLFLKFRYDQITKDKSMENIGLLFSDTHVHRIANLYEGLLKKSSND